MEWKSGFKFFLKKVLGLFNLILFLFIVFICMRWGISVLIKMDRANAELMKINSKLSTLSTELKSFNKSRTIPVTLTAYSPTPDQCGPDPFTTASGEKVRTGIVALSRDIEKEYNLKFGDKIKIIGLGVFEFQDRMHRKWKKKVDIFLWERRKAIEFGKRQGKIKIVSQ